MQDPETKSLWSQITGECISGPQEGIVLAQFPSQHTTYAEFKKSFPDGFLLAKTEKGEAGSHYQSYFDDPDRLGIFGRANTFQKLAAKDLVYGLRDGQKQIAIAESYLQRHGWVLTKKMSTPVLIAYDSASHTVAAFAWPKSVEVNSDSVVIKDGTLSVIGLVATWEAYTGRVIAGTEQDLRSIPLVTAFWFAWISFFPDTELIK